MIRHKNIDPSSAHRQVGRQLQIFYANTQAAYILGVTAASAMTVGTALTLLETVARLPHSIAFTSGAAQTSAFTFTIVGENQFGETVSESVTTTGALAVNHSLFCYRRIISITPTAKSSGGTDTVTIGTVLTVTSGTPRIPLPFKPTSTASIAFIAMANAGTQPVFTVVGTPFFALSVATTPLAGNPLGCVMVITNEDDPTL